MKSVVSPENMFVFVLGWFAIETEEKHKLYIKALTLHSVAAAWYLYLPLHV